MSLIPPVTFLFARKAATLASAAGIAVVAWSPLTAAETTKTKYPPALEKLLKEEKAAREACKIKMCGALRAGASGEDISCKIIKTVPKQDLSEKIKQARVSWPWGHAKCEMDLNVARQTLLDAAAKPEYTAAFGAHTVTCKVEREDNDPYAFEATVSPTITFKNGKAVDGAINWGKIDAPLLAKGAIWSATALDNKAGLFNDDLVEAMNTFMGKKCDEVKDAWSGG
ncbi:MAG: hypothetical protein AAFQ42_05580 [Pseudomonadota bacterium]